MSTIAVVGAGPQLGRAIAWRFAREGYDVALVARDRERLADMAAELGTSGVSAAAFPADVTDRAGLRAALAAAEEHFGSIDVLEFSPGPTASDFAERPAVDASVLTVESIVPEIEMTLYGGVTAIGQVLPGMLERGSGTILVSAGSGAGPMVIPGVANYNVATAGLRNLVLGLNASVAARGVYAAHVSIAAFIGQGRPGSEPDVIADAYWRLHTERTEPELFYNDLPEDFVFEKVSTQFTDS
ncbi:short subunit dehydrogenase [Pseudonocardia sediminis]|uniref:Short subunit dehydrogenase n=1 Tax=Pseudonocardia sediminis TaxID=1397368 RepID=A0A4Q7UYU3_PSEST|nr:SDR family NAD(P)-dependent oxidoreductase [Pseudonocardia sediminis]RZT85359.1 short subunit dehydrogenase [Pseudonocardia sediminis]